MGSSLDLTHRGRVLHLNPYDLGRDYGRILPQSLCDDCMGRIMIAKPSPLERRIAKYVKTTKRQQEKQARQRQAERKWRALSAMVCHRDKGICRVCEVPTLKAGHGDPKLWGQAHHIIYRSAGGPDALWNLVWICSGCSDAEHIKHTIDISGTDDNLTVTRR